jgi:hypothetical protein
MAQHDGRTWVAQVRFVSRGLVADILDAIVDVLIGLRETSSGDVLVGDFIGRGHDVGFG